MLDWNSLELEASRLGVHIGSAATGFFDVGEQVPLLASIRKIQVEIRFSNG